MPLTCEQAFDDPVIPKFLYGSHYSNLGVVLFWLVRLEPFTSHLLTLQGGKFDHPERTFFSLAQVRTDFFFFFAIKLSLIPLAGLGQLSEEPLRREGAYP